MWNWIFSELYAWCQTTPTGVRTGVIVLFKNSKKWHKTIVLYPKKVYQTFISVKVKWRKMFFSLIYLHYWWKMVDEIECNLWLRILNLKFISILSVLGIWSKFIAFCYRRVWVLGSTNFDSFACVAWSWSPFLDGCHSLFMQVRVY